MNDDTLYEAASEAEEALTSVVESGDFGMTDDCASTLTAIRDDLRDALLKAKLRREALARPVFP